MKTIIIIDTFGFFFRAYYALPPLRNSEGLPTGLLTGFINLIDTFRRDHKGDYIIFALDSQKSFRKELYPPYKANRGEAPADLQIQLPIAIEWIKRMGFANISMEGYEADDIIASVTKLAREKNLKVKIVSHDKDLYQLIDEGVTIYDAIKRIEIGREECIAKFGVTPKDFTNFQAIMGDSSDNIIGVKGIGAKGAEKLINKFHTLENIYANIEECGTARTQKLLLEGKDMAFLSRKLVTLKSDLPIELELESMKFEDKNYFAPLLEDFKRYEMQQAIKKVSQNENRVVFNYVTLNQEERLFQVLKRINSHTLIAFDIETTGLNIRKDSLVGFSFCFEGDRAYYVPVGHSYLGVSEQIGLESAIQAIKHILRAKVIGQNLKFDLSFLYEQFGVEEIIPYGDTMIMAWLLNPSSRIGLDSLASKFLNYEMKPFKDLVKRGDTIANVDIESASFYASEDAFITYKLYPILNLEIERRGVSQLKWVEFQFISVLIGMEREGIKIDVSKLNSLKGILSSKIERLSQEIFSLTGREFNLNSPKQLGVVLFEELKLKGGKRTKTGYSTNERVLKSIMEEHEVIPKILEYRATQKLLSTYVLPLSKLAQADVKSRIYTSFLQTGTSTGRLSSKEPNLQNIPVRSKLGREIRGAFISKEGYKLLSIDYSQIELRLLAHFSQDEVLLKSFRDGLDIHTATAVKLFGEERAKEKRAVAKSINFGILYGMGAKKLADELKISTKEAREIIKSYFDSFPTVKSFLEKTQERVKHEGFVETILKRRRFFDYQNANGMQKSAFMRESINTLFQGSASDLIKLAMLKIADKIQGIDGKMLLQIHDELIFEVEESIVKEVANEFKTIMEGIFPLNVPLKCSVAIGNSWGELK